MQSMNFEQRIEAIKTWMRLEILPRFNPPNNLDIKIVLQDIADSINYHLPSKVAKEEMPGYLSAVQTYVVRNATSRTLPPVRIFIEATKHIPRSHGEDAQQGGKQNHMSSHLRMAIARIRGGKPVSDYFINGNGRAKVKAHGITDQQLAPYDEWFRITCDEVYHGIAPPQVTNKIAAHKEILRGAIKPVVDSAACMQ